MGTVRPGLGATTEHAVHTTARLLSEIHASGRPTHKLLKRAARGILSYRVTQTRAKLGKPGVWSTSRFRAGPVGVEYEGILRSAISRRTQPSYLFPPILSSSPSSYLLPPPQNNPPCSPRSSSAAESPTQHLFRVPRPNLPSVAPSAALFPQLCPRPTHSRLVLLPPPLNIPLPLLRTPAPSAGAPRDPFR